MGVQCCKSVVHGVKGTVHKDGVGHRASVVFGLRFIPLFAVVVPFHQEGIFGGQPGEEMSTLHGQPPFKRRLTGVDVMQNWGPVWYEKRLKTKSDYQIRFLRHVLQVPGVCVQVCWYHTVTTCTCINKSITYDYHTGTTGSTYVLKLSLGTFALLCVHNTSTSTVDLAHTHVM